MTTFRFIQYTYKIHGKRRFFEDFLDAYESLDREVKGLAGPHFDIINHIETLAFPLTVIQEVHTPGELTDGS